MRVAPQPSIFGSEAGWGSPVGQTGAMGEDRSKSVESGTEAGVTHPTAPASGSSLKRKAIIGVSLIVLLGISWVVGAAVMPRWWSHRVGDVVDGRLAFGGMVGFGVGAAFTILPLLILRAGWKFRAGWKRWLKFVVFAFVAASPNLLTLGIVIGSSSAAHAAERTLDVEGGGFRGGTLLGCVAGSVLVFLVGLLMRSRRKNKQLAATLKAELAQRASEDR